MNIGYANRVPEESLEAETPETYDLVWHRIKAFYHSDFDNFIDICDISEPDVLGWQADADNASISTVHVPLLLGVLEFFLVAGA